MPGFQYVTLLDDKRTHVLGPGERTECGLPIPIHGGAELLRDAPGDICRDCTKHVDVLEAMTPAAAEAITAAVKDKDLTVKEPVTVKTTVSFGEKHPDAPSKSQTSRFTK